MCEINRPNFVFFLSRNASVKSENQVLLQQTRPHSTSHQALSLIYQKLPVILTGGNMTVTYWTTVLGTERLWSFDFLKKILKHQPMTKYQVVLTPPR